jgi:hypothetical protein
VLQTREFALMHNASESSTMTTTRTFARLVADKTTQAATEPSDDGIFLTLYTSPSYFDPEHGIFS